MSSPSIVPPSSSPPLEMSSEQSPFAIRESVIPKRVPLYAIDLERDGRPIKNNPKGVIEKTTPLRISRIHSHVLHKEMLRLIGIEGHSGFNFKADDFIFLPDAIAATAEEELKLETINAS